MRSVIELRRSAGIGPHWEIELAAKSRNDIPVLLIGLQAIYANDTTGTELFGPLGEHIIPARGL